jgi:hypothetical protein
MAFALRLDGSGDYPHPAAQSHIRTAVTLAWP